MLPDFDDEGLLPVGIHPATWEEVYTRFGKNDHRKRLLSGLKLALESLRSAGCKAVYLDGSFVTNKENPNDYDICWDTTGVDEQKLDPVLLESSFPRNKQKMKFGGEFLANNPWDTWPTFFQQVKNPITKERKGIVKIGLGEFP